MRFQLSFLCSCLYVCDFVEPHLQARTVHLVQASYNTFIMIQIWTKIGDVQVKPILLKIVEL
jgi:hypothetical protein